jgi:sulfur carrier protein
MILIINGENLELANTTTAKDLIIKLGYKNQLIALEINENIISKSEYQNFILKAGDKINIIEAVGGG